MSKLDTNSRTRSAGGSVPLLEEAAKVNALANFEDLPLDLQVVALRKLIEIARDHHRAVLRDYRLQRAWYEIDLENLPQAVRIIE